MVAASAVIDEEVRCAAAKKGEVRLDGMSAGIVVALGTGREVRLGMEIVERGDARDDRSERLRDLRVGDVREVSRAIHREGMDRRVKRALHLIERAGKLDEIVRGSEVFDPEAVSLEPGADCLDVGIRGTELGSKLRGGEPAMKVRRCGVLQIGQIRGERLLLSGASLQDEGETAGGRRGRGRSSIEARLSERMNIATERNETAFVDGGNDP